MKIKRYVLAGALLVAACRQQPEVAPTPTGQATGGASARQAVEMFMAAVKAQDLQALSFVWGGKDGPAITLGTMTREEMEKREIIMICHLAHDKFRITGESPAPNNERNLTVELTRTATNETRTTTFLTTPGPGKRWYVVQPDLNPLKDFCRGQQ